MAELMWTMIKGVHVSVNVSMSIYIAHQQADAGCASTVRTKMSSRRLKAALVEFGLRTGSGRPFQADGPAVEKARGQPYMLSR